MRISARIAVMILVTAVALALALAAGCSRDDRATSSEAQPAEQEVPALGAVSAPNPRKESLPTTMTPLVPPRDTEGTSRIPSAAEALLGR